MGVDANMILLARKFSLTVRYLWSAPQKPQKSDVDGILAPQLAQNFDSVGVVGASAPGGGLSWNLNLWLRLRVLWIVPNLTGCSSTIMSIEASSE